MTMMEGDPLAQPLAELLSAAVQTRLMFSAFRRQVPEATQTDFLAIEQRLFDIEIQLRQLNLQHPMSAATSGPSVRTIH